MPTPHRLVNKVLDGLVEGIKNVGETVSSTLDKPPAEVGGPQGIHRILDRVLDGSVDAMMTGGEGICHGLDQPVEQFGVPPDISPGTKFPRLGR